MYVYICIVYQLHELTMVSRLSYSIISWCPASENRHAPLTWKPHQGTSENGGPIWDRKFHVHVLVIVDYMYFNTKHDNLYLIPSNHVWYHTINIYQSNIYFGGQVDLTDSQIVWKFHWHTPPLCPETARRQEPHVDLDFKSPIDR
jgi:hypothetical protein